MSAAISRRLGVTLEQLERITVNNPTALRAVVRSEALIDKNMPAGWRKEFVDPPWRRDPSSKCRGCGITPEIAKPGTRWGIAAIVKHDRNRCVVLYSFGRICDRCVQSRKVMNRLAVEVFAPLAPPGPIPDDVGGKLPEG